jgi:hypothetical protein
MYEVTRDRFYRVFQPDDPTHAGSPGWSQAPVPGWGVNPVRVGPPAFGAVAAAVESPLVAAIQQAAKSTVFLTRESPAAYVPPVHRQVPAQMFNELIHTAAPWGTFPNQRAYNGIGAYYVEAPLRAVAGLGAEEITDEEEIEDSWKPLFSESQLPSDQRQASTDEEAEEESSGSGLGVPLLLGALGIAAIGGIVYFARKRGG